MNTHGVRGRETGKKPFRADQQQQALELRACARGDYLFVMNAYVYFPFLNLVLCFPFIL
jgi:hypothetical protein